MSRLPLPGTFADFNTISRPFRTTVGFPSHDRSELKESCAKYLPLYPLIRSILRRTPSGSTITFGNPAPAAPLAIGRIVGTMDGACGIAFVLASTFFTERLARA